MIQKLPNFENKYYIGNLVGYELSMFIRQYPGKIHCIICNQSTADKHFNRGGKVTVNNHIEDEVIFINHIR